MSNTQQIDHRDIFNAIISCAVKTKIATGKAHLNLETYRFLFNRETVSGFLWDAFRELECGGTLSWGNLQAIKNEKYLEIRILSCGKHKDVVSSMILPTDARILGQNKKMKGREGK